LAEGKKQKRRGKTRRSDFFIVGVDTASGNEARKPLRQKGKEFEDLTGGESKRARVIRSLSLPLQKFQARSPEPQPKTISVSRERGQTVVKEGRAPPHRRTRPERIAREGSTCANPHPEHLERRRNKKRGE